MPTHTIAQTKAKTKLQTQNHTKSLVWFRRDLRSFDHAALHAALTETTACYCVFIFDTTILQHLPKQDRRVQFIHESIQELAASLKELGGNLIVRIGDPKDEIPRLAAELEVQAVYINHDYEPAAISRDADVKQKLNSFNCVLKTYKDQVIFEHNEVLSLSEKPYSVFTPYKNAWLKKLVGEGSDFYFSSYPIEKYQHHFQSSNEQSIPSLQELGFDDLSAQVPSATSLKGGMKAAQLLLDNFLERMHQYDVARDFPSIKGPSYLSTHLRFGTVSIRHLVREAMDQIRRSETSQGAKIWLSELIWRDFYFMILSHHPRVIERAFKPEYDQIKWETGDTAQTLFKAWCDGQTGYPLVDAAMHQLNQTGYMHNRLRMVTACFLVKDLGIDWRWGEAYFARQLIDFDLSANNGGWQWAASTGCDAQPYFRIFNPITQSEKFDTEGKFIRRYLPQLQKLSNKHIHAPWKTPPLLLAQAGVNLGSNLGSNSGSNPDSNYPYPIVEHDIARKICLERYAVVKNKLSLNDEMNT